MHVVAVCNVVLVGDFGDNTETLFEAFCEFVCRAFERRTVKRKCNVFLCTPCCACVVKVMHDLQCKRSSFGIGMRFTCHIARTFAKACITEGNCRISVKKQLVDFFTFLKPCNCTVLPENGCRVTFSSLQAVVAYHERAFAEYQPFIHYFPELIHVASGRACDINKIKRNNTLIEPSVEFRLSVFVVIDGEERAASHARITVAVFQFKHLFFRNIIGDKTARRAFCSKLRQIIII